MRRPNARPEHQAQSLAPAKMGPSRHHRRRRSRLAFSAAGALLASGAFFLLLSSPARQPYYGVVIDAGSTGSRAHVIAYRGGELLPRLDLARTASMKATPGLSAFAGRPGDAGESLVELVEFARSRVPRERWADTEVRLMATAGLRLLDAAVVGTILESCRLVLRKSGFRFRDEWAAVISGADEGIYAWVAANYALGTLGGDPAGTTGIVELGGASFQVTLVTDESLPSEFSHVLKFGEVIYNLYSHSFLHLGQNVAYESLHDLLSSSDSRSTSELSRGDMYRDPCTPRGYLHIEAVQRPASVIRPKIDYRSFAHAVGNFSECRSAAFALLQKVKEKCTCNVCRLGASYVPRLEGRFLATENFYHTSKFFGLGPKSLLSDLMLAGERFCHDDWSKIKKKHRSLDEGELLLFCFSSAYIVALLHDSLGISMDDKRIDFANQVRGVPVDWALGAFIMQRAPNLTTDTEYQETVSYLIADCSGLLRLFFIPAMVVFTACSLLKWRRPHEKAVCNAEKGWCVLSRVSR